MCGMNRLYAWHDSIPFINCEVREYGVEFVTHMQNSWGIHMSSSWLIVASSSWHIHALIASISASRPTWTSYVTHTHNFMSHTHTIWNPHCPPPSVSIGLTNRSFSFIYGVRDSFISEVRDSHIPLNPHCRPHQHPPDWQIDDILIRMWGSWLIHIWSSWPTHTSKSKLPPPSASIKLTNRWYTHSCVGAVTHSYIKFVTHTYLEIHTAAPVSIH